MIQDQTPTQTPATIVQLAANTRAVESLKGTVLELVARTGAVEDRLGQVETSMAVYTTAAKAVVARHPVTARQIAAIATLVTALSGAIGSWQIGRQAKAEAAQSAAVTTEQTYDRRAERDRDQAIAKAVEAQAAADRAMWSARVESAKVEAERRASMRRP
jgi:hypothetical protein